LAEIILEPMLTLYGPTFIITSGFRDKTGGSLHNKGQAVDIQFPGFTAQQYWDRAKEIRDDKIRGTQNSNGKQTHRKDPFASLCVYSFEPASG